MRGLTPKYQKFYDKLKKAQPDIDDLWFALTLIEMINNYNNMKKYKRG